VGEVHRNVIKAKPKIIERILISEYNKITASLFKNQVVKVIDASISEIEDSNYVANLEMQAKDQREEFREALLKESAFGWAWLSGEYEK